MQDQKCTNRCFPCLKKWGSSSHPASIKWSYTLVTWFRVVSCLFLPFRLIWISLFSGQNIPLQLSISYCKMWDLKLAAHMTLAVNSVKQSPIAVWDWLHIRKTSEWWSALSMDMPTIVDASSHGIRSISMGPALQKAKAVNISLQPQMMSHKLLGTVIDSTVVKQLKTTFGSGIKTNMPFWVWKVRNKSDPFANP